MLARMILLICVCLWFSKDEHVSAMSGGSHGMDSHGKDSHGNSSHSKDSHGKHSYCKDSHGKDSPGGGSGGGSSSGSGEYEYYCHCGSSGSRSRKHDCDRCPPRAIADCDNGSPLWMSAGSHMIQDGNSTDDEGIVSYVWTEESWPTPIGTFTFDNSTGEGTIDDITTWRPLTPYIFRLTVTDDAGNSDYVLCTIFVRDDIAPVAAFDNCPGAVVVDPDLGNLILDASASSDLADPIDPLNFAFNVISEGAVPIIGLQNGDKLEITNTYYLTKLVDHVIEVVVTDPSLNSHTVTCTFQVAITCGDEMVDGAEECDDGNSDDLDSCSNTCTINARSCQELADNGKTIDGLYNIFSCNSDTPTQVLCDFSTVATEGWIVIQKRFDGQTDFWLEWDDYKNGFGTPGTTEFWIGLDTIYDLTSGACAGAYEIRFDMEKFDGTPAYETYSSFSITDESDYYRLSVSGPAGTAGNDMAHHNNRQFSTRDNDNDDCTCDCAVRYLGAWWYGACHKSNPNGDWGNNNYADGIIWFSFTTYYESLKKMQISVRPSPP